MNRLSGDLRSLILCAPNYATGNARPGVAGRLRFEIVRLRVHDYGTSDRRTFVVRERDLMVHILQCRLARRVCLYISHVPHVPFGRIGPRMWLLGWIKVTTGRSGVGCTAIAELMDMKAMIAGSQAGDFRPDLYAIGLFSESNRTADFTACGGMKHCDGFQGCRGFFRRCLGLRAETGRQRKYQRNE